MPGRRTSCAWRRSLLLPRLILCLPLGLMAAAGPSAAAAPTPSAPTEAKSTAIAPIASRTAAADGYATVVEMFVSQACRESPPAAAYAAELSDRRNVLALTFHIDYWNVLSNRRTGRWRDPFGASEFAARQRVYNASIRHRASVLTPQAIVAGRAAENGADRPAVERQIASAQDQKGHTGLAVRNGPNGLVAAIEPAGPARSDVYVVHFLPHVVTDVPAGDNAGVRFDERNVVRRIAKIGEVTGQPAALNFPPPPAEQACAVLVQAAGQGEILAAAKCP
jgi:hypothetical protein